jgi:D-3-phosphoglycerate dehydrogenase
VYRVLIVQPLHQDGLGLLERRPDITYEILPEADPDDLLRLAPGVDAITLRDAPLPALVVEAAPRLRVVSRHGVGYDNVPVDLCTARGIPVTITGSVNTVAVAEHTMYLLLAAARSGVQLDQAVRAGDFAIRGRSTAMELAGRTLLIVGLGRIGRAVATRAKAFGMDVMAHDPNIESSQLPTDATDQVELIDDLEQALALSDAVSIHVPLTNETRGLIDDRRLGMLRPGAIVVSTARGGVVDEAALLSAVGQGHLHGAGLDVFSQEPLPADSPLINEPRIVLSPHCAALTEDSLRAMSIKTVENVFAALAGTLDRALVINPQVLDRRL